MDHHPIAHTHRHDTCDPPVTITRIHSKILQHLRNDDRTHCVTHTSVVCDPFAIITIRSYNIIASGSHTHTQIRRMRSVCNHHSKILQHLRNDDRIITLTHTQCYTHTYVACDPFVIITPRFYNIIASGIRFRIAQTHRYDVCDPFVIITPIFYNIIASGSHKHTDTMYAIRL